MNLSEDKKEPLRNKSFELKRNMVAQWLNKTTIVKVIIFSSVFCLFFIIVKRFVLLKGSEQSKSPQQFIHELLCLFSNDEIILETERELLKVLESLRVSLNSNPLR